MEVSCSKPCLEEMLVSGVATCHYAFYSYITAHKKLFKKSFSSIYEIALSYVCVCIYI